MDGDLYLTDDPKDDCLREVQAFIARGVAQYNLDVKISYYLTSIYGKAPPPDGLLVFPGTFWVAVPEFGPLCSVDFRNKNVLETTNVVVVGHGRDAAYVKNTNQCRFEKR